MAEAQMSPQAGRWLTEKENKKMSRPATAMKGQGWFNREGCTSEKQQRTALRECTNLPTVCTIPDIGQQSTKKKFKILRSGFKVTPGRKSARRQSKRVKARTKAIKDVENPSYVVVKGDAMDVIESHERFTQHGLPKLPCGVRDIVFLCPEYACDIITYLQEVETKWTFASNYLHGDSEVTPKMRAILFDWLIQVQNHENLNEDTLHLTVAMVDRYTSIMKLQLVMLQLLGITCLLIAAKYNERFPPEISTLCRLTDNTYSSADVLEMEIIVLKTLHFDVSIPTPLVFMRRFIGTQMYSKEEYNFCEYLLDLSITNHLLLAFRASMVAASTLYIARLVFRSDDTWNPTLVYYTKYLKSDLHACVSLLSQILCKAESNDLQGARTKYSSSKRKSISKHVILKDNIDLRNAAEGIFPS